MREIGQLEFLEITVLMEDYAGYDSGLLSQHGVSFLIEAGSSNGGGAVKRVLFDTGQSARPVLDNMRLIGKDPREIDLVVLSHCHYDHTGGLAGMLGACERSRIPVIAHPSIFRPNFSVKPSFRPVGMGPENSRQAVESAGGELLLTVEPLPLMPGAVTSGEISERVSFEATPTLSLLTLEEGKMMPDLMVDDMSLFFITPGGLVIVTGCSHAGIISIIRTAVNLTGMEKVAAVIGGFHLIDAEEERIDETVRSLAAMDVDQVYTGHCTGLKAEAKMLSVLEERFWKLRTGLTIKIPGSKEV